MTSCGQPRSCVATAKLDVRAACGLRLSSPRTENSTTIPKKVPCEKKKGAEKQTSHHLKLFRDYPNSPSYLKEGDFGWS